jgi:hypothetical protein
VSIEMVSQKMLLSGNVNKKDEGIDGYVKEKETRRRRVAVIL